MLFADVQQVEAWFNLFWKIVIAGLIGAVTSSIPLWAKIRRLKAEFKAADSRQESKERINHEAEWKRIIEFRDAEMTRLRERDDQQERKIAELYKMNTECQKSEARLTERIGNLERLNASLTEKLLKFEQLFTRGSNVPDNG